MHLLTRWLSYWKVSFGLSVLLCGIIGAWFFFRSGGYFSNRIEMIVLPHAALPVYEGDVTERKVKMINRSQSPVDVVSFSKSCGCTSMLLDDREISLPKRIDAGCSFEFSVKIATVGRVGKFESHIKVNMQDENRRPIYSPETVFSFTIEKKLAAYPPVAEFKFDASDQSKKFVKVSICNTRLEDICRIKTRDVVAKLKVDVIPVSGQYNFAGWLRKQYELDLETSREEWIHSARTEITLDVEYEGPNAPAPHKLIVPVSIVLQKPFEFFPKELVVDIADSLETKNTISRVVRFTGVGKSAIFEITCSPPSSAIKISELEAGLSTTGRKFNIEFIPEEHILNQEYVLRFDFESYFVEIPVTIYCFE